MRGRGARNCGWERTVRGLGGMRSRKKEEKKTQNEGSRGREEEKKRRERLEDYGQREEDETTEGVRNCDKTRRAIVRWKRDGDGSVPEKSL